MRQNVQNLCRILRGHISKYSFICQNKCGGAIDTSHQLKESIELLVVSIQVLKKHSSQTVGQQLHRCAENILHSILGLLGSFSHGGSEVNTATGVVWRALDALAEVELTLHAATLQRFTKISARIKDVHMEMAELKENCILIDTTEQVNETENETVEAGDTAEAGASQTEEEVANKYDIDNFDDFFDDAPEHLTADDLHRVDLFSESLIYFRRVCLEIVIWLKKGLKYNPERHDEWLEGIVAHLQRFPICLDDWGAALHAPQDPNEVHEASIKCMSLFQEFVDFTNSLSQFSRRKIIRGGKGSTGREWKSDFDEKISELFSRLEIVEPTTI